MSKDPVSAWCRHLLCRWSQGHLASSSDAQWKTSLPYTEDFSAGTAPAAQILFCTQMDRRAVIHSAGTHRPSPFSIGQPSKLVEPREINQRTDPFQTEKSSVAPRGEPAVLGSGTPRFWSTTAKLHPCRSLFHCAPGGSNESSRASPFYK